MGDLPTGQVTFCFTDIEGSTRHARRLGDRWSFVLEEHKALLREVWNEFGGAEVNTEGDSFFVVFQHADHALTAAVQAQTRLAAKSWPDATDLRVRIGLHTGQAEISGTDYVGLEVHKAARIAAAAHGGQVLVSAALASTVDGRLPAGVELRELGIFSLKDFDDGDALLRVEHADLDSDAPAPRALPLAAHNLPLLRTSFIGRELEMAEVIELCAQHPVVTVLGPGGSGKTRLCIEVGRSVAPDRAAGVWAVLLAGEPTSLDISAVVARTLGVADVAGSTTIDAIAAHIGDRDLLLLLDNCEHVIEEAGKLVHALIARCPRLRVLATSRQPLVVDGERVWVMPALHLPSDETADRAVIVESQAVQLFIDRAEAAHPRFALTDANASTVARLCRSLDGLPLALELAAAATRSIPLEALAARIDSGAIGLRSSNPAHADRQRGLDELVAWSYDLLDDVQARVFRRLSVFRGGWSPSAAEAVCAVEGIEESEVLFALGDLVDRSLLTLDADDRYRMLVLLRGFAGRQLSDAERSLVEDAHREFFTARAEEIADLGMSPPGMAGAEIDLENLRVAFENALARGEGTTAYAISVGFVNFLIVRGHIGEAEQQLSRIEPLLVPDSSVRLRILINRASLLNNLGDPRWLELCDQVIALEQHSGAQRFSAHAATLKVLHLERLGELAAAVDIAEELLTQELEPLVRGQLLQTLATGFERLQGDPAAALEKYIQAADVWEAGNASLNAATARLNAAMMAQELGNETMAVEWVRAAVALADKAGYARLRSQAIYVASRLRRFARDARSSSVLVALDDLQLDEAVAIGVAIGEPRILAGWRVERAMVAVAEGRTQDAQSDLQLASPVLRAEGLFQFEGCVLQAAAAVLHALNDPAAAAVARAALEFPQDFDREVTPKVRQIAEGHQAPPPSTKEALEIVFRALVDEMPSAVAP